MCVMIQPADKQSLDVGQPSSFLSMIRSKTTHIILTVVIVMCGYLFILDKYADNVFWGNRITGFICLGDRFMPPELLPDDTMFIKNCAGYDGQFYYFIAQDPLIMGRMSPHIDSPAYRYQRIGYPLLASIFSMGSLSVLPLMLVVVNMVGILMGTLFFALMLKDQGITPWYALFYGLLSGFVIAILRDLSGPLAMGFAVGAIFFYGNRRFLWCTLFIALAVLTRETFAAVLLVLLFDSFALKRNPKSGLIVALALVPLLAWQLYIYLRLGEPSWVSGTSNLGMPFVHIFNHAKDILPSPNRACSEKWYLALTVISAVFCLALALWQVIRARNEITLCFLGFSLMPFFMTNLVWIEPWSYGRVLLPIPVFLLLSFMRSKSRLHLVPIAIQGALFLIILSWLRIT